ncbi:hypothetical protein, partial [Embleya sp. NPDC050493]|uniref:hypothetical protein n=1 Tax=Embleya sp. NPDC050493 TaxID=3363989 RepID=UPI0037A9D7B5
MPTRSAVASAFSAGNTRISLGNPGLLTAGDPGTGPTSAKPRQPVTDVFVVMSLGWISLPGSDDKFGFGETSLDEMRASLDVAEAVSD